MSVLRFKITGKGAPLKSKQEPIHGAGDWVKQKIADPIVKHMPTSLRTYFTNCGGCHGRREWLNKHFPMSGSK